MTAPPTGPQRGTVPSRLRWVLAGFAISALPVLVGLHVGATTFSGGTLVPWHPVMVDLGVYRQAGTVLLQGGNFYALSGPLQFLYPPFAALLAVPLALLPTAYAEIAWTVAGVLAVLAVLHRLGLTGWRLSLVATATVVLVEPVSETLAFGQVGIVLVALVFLDLAPGPRVLGGPGGDRRPLLPEGVLTGLAMAIKLTPAIFVLYLVAVRRWRAAIGTTVTAAAVTLATAVVLPGASLDFWGRLAHGDTGLGNSIIYYTNQSVMADTIRILGLGRDSALVGLVASTVVALVGVWAATLWHRLGHRQLGVTVCGIAGLLASPVSWLHHFVWVLPLAIGLLDLRRGEAARRSAPTLPAPVQVVGWLFVGWVVAAPFRRLPNGGDVEVTYTLGQQLMSSTTALLGLAFFVVAIVAAQQLRLRRPAAVRAPVADPSATS